MRVSHEEFKKNLGKPLKLRALVDGIIYADPRREYKKGDVLEAEFIGSMVFFLKGGESISYYDFELA